MEIDERLLDIQHRLLPGEPLIRHDGRLFSGPRRRAGNKAQSESLPGSQLLFLTKIRETYSTDPEAPAADEGCRGDYSFPHQIL